VVVVVVSQLSVYICKSYIGKFNVILYNGDDCFCTALLPDDGPVRPKICRSVLKY